LNLPATWLFMFLLLSPHAKLANERTEFFRNLQLLSILF
jgi:hypothetical protein